MNYELYEEAYEYWKNNPVRVRVDESMWFRVSIMTGYQCYDIYSEDVGYDIEDELGDWLEYEETYPTPRRLEIIARNEAKDYVRRLENTYLEGEPFPECLEDKLVDNISAYFAERYLKIAERDRVLFSDDENAEEDDWCELLELKI